MPARACCGGVKKPPSAWEAVGAVEALPWFLLFSIGTPQPRPPSALPAKSAAQQSHFNHTSITWDSGRVRAYPLTDLQSCGASQPLPTPKLVVWTLITSFSAIPGRCSSTRYKVLRIDSSLVGSAAPMPINLQAFLRAWHSRIRCFGRKCRSACMNACMHACVRACVRASERACNGRGATDPPEEQSIKGSKHSASKAERMCMRVHAELRVRILHACTCRMYACQHSLVVDLERHLDLAGN
eukprot:358582-Chlamydomonas_euryale.AAC.16